MVSIPCDTLNTCVCSIWNSPASDDDVDNHFELLIIHLKTSTFCKKLKSLWRRFHGNFRKERFFSNFLWFPKKILNNLLLNDLVKICFISSNVFFFLIRTKLFSLFFCLTFARLFVFESSEVKQQLKQQQKFFNMRLKFFFSLAGKSFLSLLLDENLVACKSCKWKSSRFSYTLESPVAEAKDFWELLQHEHVTWTVRECINWMENTLTWELRMKNLQLLEKFSEKMHCSAS